MKIYNQFLIFLGIIMLIIIWKIYSYFNPNYEKCFSENNQEFNSKLAELNSLVANIKLLKLNECYDVSSSELPDNLKNKCEYLGVKSFSYIKISNKSCNEKFRIELSICENWNIKTLNNVKLIYSPCDENTNKNCHFHDGFHIDTWGQGQNWLIFSDTDFI